MHERSLRLKHGRGVVLEPFLNRVYSIERVRRLIWVSPWITHLSFKTGDTKRLLNRIAQDEVYLTIITRKPEHEALEHANFLRDTESIRSCEIFFIPYLHAKYYICQTDDRSFAVVGSPNMYRWTERSFEIGVDIEGRGEGEVILTELETVTDLLRLPSNGENVKRLGELKGALS